MNPIRLNISAGRIRFVEFGLHGRRSDRIHRAGDVAAARTIDVAGNGQVIFRRKLAINAESAAQNMPAIASISAREPGQMILIEILGEYAVVGALAGSSSVLQSAESLVQVSSSCYNHSSATF